jgi:hypothetical protein
MEFDPNNQAGLSKPACRREPKFSEGTPGIGPLDILIRLPDFIYQFTTKGGAG